MRSWRIVAALAAIAVVVQCYGLYRATGPPTPPWFPHFDKVEHAVGFAIPVLLVLLALGLRRRSYGDSGLSRSSVPAVAGIFFAQALLSEILQHFCYRYRTGDPLDVVADTTGVGLGVAGALVSVRRLGLRRPAREPVPR